MINHPGDDLLGVQAKVPGAVKAIGGVGVVMDANEAESIEGFQPLPNRHPFVEVHEPRLELGLGKPKVEVFVLGAGFAVFFGHIVELGGFLALGQLVVVPGNEKRQ
jgi:hypothetical protein